MKLAVPLALCGLLKNGLHARLKIWQRLPEIIIWSIRINAELTLASDIQAHMLPCIFPPFPEHDEFDLYATMPPAKKVGGDFYDFYMLDEDHLAVVIADVSGKGVPAALFMVITKTLIKNQAQMGLEVNDVFTVVNQLLCEGNDAGIFVTAWMGILDVTSGKLTYANAGHPPSKAEGWQFHLSEVKTRTGTCGDGRNQISEE